MDLASIIEDISKWQNQAIEACNRKEIVRIKVKELEELKNVLEIAQKGKQEEGIKELLTITKEIKNKLPNANTQKIQSQVAMIETPIGASTIANNVVATTRNVDNRK